MNLPLEHRRATNRGSSTLRMVSIILMATLWLPNLRSMTRATKLGDRHQSGLGSCAKITEAKAGTALIRLCAWK